MEDIPEILAIVARQNAGGGGGGGGGGGFSVSSITDIEIKTILKEF